MSPLSHRPLHVAVGWVEPGLKSSSRLGIHVQLPVAIKPPRASLMHVCLPRAPIQPPHTCVFPKPPLASPSFTRVPHIGAQVTTSICLPWVAAYTTL
ncbi:hypothetical protein AMTR_s00134p00051580 [Amborella trichopoda]|uniref:Uncharacterized protein n=1 Tax=Amborella trichopoda TaxID=13333 RepID=W1P5J4_AMBTC|nr:hypothetical protein AMTR_s00134p00051580 [Amborella trichopoda]